MTEIVIKKYAQSPVPTQDPVTHAITTGTVLYTYHMKNYVQYLPNLQMPIDQIAMPESDAGSAVLTKLFGNTLQFTLDWVLMNEPTSVVDETTVKTSHDQMLFLLTSFAQQSLSDVYSITISAPSDGSTRTYVNIGCAITAITVSRSKVEPVSYVASMTVQIGTYYLVPAP